MKSERERGMGEGVAVGVKGKRRCESVSSKLFEHNIHMGFLGVGHPLSSLPSI